MSRSYTNIIIHLIFHVKGNDSVIEEAELSQLFRYIGGTIRHLSGFAYTVGGRPDHVHILASLPVTMGLADFVRDIKANTSKWIKQLKPEYKNFSWQEGYAAFSVSESVKDSVINYINGQKEHHKIRSAHDELIQFLERNHISCEHVTANRQSTP